MHKPIAERATTLAGVANRAQEPGPGIHSRHVRRHLSRTLGPLLLFCVLALVWSYPLVFHLSDRIPGETVGDNVVFLWNLWWMRQAGTSFFFTPLLFAPFGSDLSLHTHTALQGAIASTLLRRVSLIPAQNVLIIATLARNGFAAYLLALDRTKDTAAALVAGLVFGGSSYVAAHLLGHFNLISVWTLPLAVLCVLRTLERRSLVWSALTGLCFVSVAYTDYYYTVYDLLISAGLIVSGTGVMRVTLRPKPLSPRMRGAIAVLLATIAVFVATIAMTGGFDRTILGVRVRATDAGNLPTAAWAIVLLALGLRVRPMLEFGTRSDLSLLMQRLQLLRMAALVFVVGTLPLIVHIAGLWLAGDYSAPSHFWRSGPTGVDLSTLVLGNPFHPLTGGWTTAAYNRWGLDRVDGMGWIGVIPTAFLLWGITNVRSSVVVRRTVFGGAVFFLWSLGPWLTIAGVNTGLMLPANVFGLLPILSNARMPGRAIVVTILAAALLGARWVANAPTLRRRTFAWGLGLLLIAECLPAPFPLVRLETPALYSTIRASEPGAVLELPMGLRDGLALEGGFDDSVLVHQMTHGRPLVGGFAARLAPSIKRGYADMPVVRSLLRLSDASHHDPDPRDLALSRDEVTASLRAVSIRFVVLDRARVSPQLMAFIESFIPLTLVQREGQRDLFTIAQ